MSKEHKPSNLLRSTARRLAVIAVVISPWLIGSSDGWAYLLMCMLIGLASIAWLLSLLPKEQINIIAAKPLLVMLLFALFVAIQGMELPQQLVKTLNPASAAVTTDASAVIKTASDIPTPSAPSASLRDAVPKPTTKSASSWASSDGGSGRANSSSVIHHSSFITHHSRLSVSPRATSRALLLVIAFISIFAILSNTIKTWSELRKTVITIIIYGSIMAFLGTIHKLLGSDKILWFHIPRYGGGIFGPFTNTNHYAVHMNMIFALSLGLYFSNVNSAQTSKHTTLDYNRSGRICLLLLGMVIMAGSVCISLSRGGIVALLGGIAISTMLTSLSRDENGKRQSRKFFTSALFFIIAGTIWFGWEPVVNELATIAKDASAPLESNRFTVVKDTIKIFTSYPLSGSGFGTFQYTFPSYQSIGGYSRWTHAHNDWIQLLAEGGIIGTTLFFLAIICWIRYIYTNFSKAYSKARQFTTGALVGIYATAIYSMWEYGLHKPANGILLMSLAGLSVAAISMRESKHKHSATVQSATTIQAGRLTRVLIIVLILLSSWLIYSTSNQLRGELAYTRFIYFQKLAPNTATPDEHKNAIMSACSEAKTLYSMPINNPTALREVAEIMQSWCQDPQLDTKTRIRVAEIALPVAMTAVQTAPTDYPNWVTLARSYAILNQWETAEIYLNHARTLAAPNMPVRMFLKK